QPYRVFLMEGEVDENCGVIDVDVELLRLDRSLERQSKMQRQHSQLRIVVKVVVRGLGELHFLPVRLREGEEAVFLQRANVDLGKRGPFLAREPAAQFALATLRRLDGKHLMEG